MKERSKILTYVFLGKIICQIHAAIKRLSLGITYL